MRRESRWRTNKGEKPFPRWCSGNVTTTENETVGRERAVHGFTYGLGIGAVDLAVSKGHYPAVSLTACMLLTSSSSFNIFPSIIPAGLPLKAHWSRNNYHGQVPVMLYCPNDTLLSSLIGQLQVGFPLASLSNPSCG